MILLIALLVLVLGIVVATIVEVRRDGYRQTPTDWTRVAERGATSQPELTRIYR